MSVQLSVGVKEMKEDSRLPIRYDNSDNSPLTKRREKINR
jgi:hypothetical protein